MRGNLFGNVFNVTTFGESHGPAIGAVIDGCPAGVTWNEDLLRTFLERRRPGTSDLVSARKELDQAEVLSGVFTGKTLGTPIALLVRNVDQRSQDYDPKLISSRRGHATDLWQEKYGHSDPRGSGRASGRETVSRILAGAVARMLTEMLYPELRVLVYADSLAAISMTPEECEFAEKNLQLDPWKIDQFSLRLPQQTKNDEAEAKIRKARESGESFGGTIRMRIESPPRGLGEPVFGKLKNCLAASMLSVGATTAFEFGDGFASSKYEGRVFHNPTQSYGGIRGGISTGDAIVARVALKPTSSFGDVATKGRHDPCVVPRAIPVLEAMVWLVLADLILLKRLDQI